MKKYLPYILLFVLVLLLTTETEAQCAMCKKIADGKNPDDLTAAGKSINSAILYLMAFPYIAIAFIFRKQLGDLIRGLRKKSA